MAEISVVVPVYNVEKYICRCLDSIIRQSFQNIEIIVVDDGSTDRSGVICDEYQMKDARIHVIHQANRGLSGARNTGIEWIINNSPSRWLCFIDSDDWINTVYFEELYNVANKYKCMISACDFYTVTEDTESVNTGHIYEGMISVEELYNRHFYVAQSACAKLFDISLFSQCNLRFRENVLYEDSDIIYQVFQGVSVF